ncbi:MAG: purine-binding chemotaxis protein CheW [Deltaproteobacteria bacterium]|jgi:purine-binding chemotaxis protein CheW|nr:MAG: purine-binding chemotaxis protein CheW [Deltaproteobacteria bacterium]
MPDFPSGPGKKILEQIRRAQQNQHAPVAKDSPQQQYLSFRLNEEWYALSVYQLVEVLPLPKITRVPSVPDHILGVMNLRGEVLSAIDLKKILGLPQETPAVTPSIVVVEEGGVRTGLLVDDIGDLVDLGLDDLTEEPLLTGKAQPAFFEGAAHWGGILLSVINLRGLLQAEGMYSPQG